MNIESLLVSILSVLTDPNAWVPAEPEIGKLYLEDRAKYDQTAREWNRIHAIKNK